VTECGRHRAIPNFIWYQKRVIVNSTARRPTGIVSATSLHDTGYLRRQSTYYCHLLEGMQESLQRSACCAIRADDKRIEKVQLDLFARPACCHIFLLLLVHLIQDCARPAYANVGDAAVSLAERFHR